MRLTITSVDHAPEKFHAITPIEVRLIRRLPGPDRPDYWLGEVLKPFEYMVDAGTLVARHFILAARWQGTQIEPKVENLPINIAVVTDDSQLTELCVDFAKSNFVAIGLANEVEGGSSPEPLTNIMAGTIGRFFGRGAKS
ncbi:MAG TPA: hypothetical protein VF928_07605 [Usitatibacteraceae bacterium]